MSWRLGVVGSPIAHSLSPHLHEEALRLCGLEGTSQRYELDAARAPALRDLLPSQFDALSVTAPLKHVAYGLCDEVDDVAARTESVNSLLVRDGRLMGRSTDGDGFVDAMAHHFRATPSDRHVVVLGAGGAASAIVDALVRHGASSVVLHARNEARIEAIAERHPHVFSHSLVYRPVDLIVNTLPASARDEGAAVLQGVSPDTLAVDITYEPRRSAWLELYEGLGCSVANGLGMLAFQAARQLEWWFEEPVSGAALLAVLS